MSIFMFITCLTTGFITSLFGEDFLAMAFLLASSIFYLAYVIEKK